MGSVDVALGFGFLLFARWVIRLFMALAMPRGLNDDELRRGVERSVWPGSGFQGGGIEREIVKGV